MSKDSTISKHEVEKTDCVPISFTVPCEALNFSRQHQRHKEHIRYIRNNSNTSAYAMHILDNRHEYGTAESTLKLIQPCRKGAHMNSWESLYIHMYRQQGKLITEQQAKEHNSLYNLALPPQRYTAVSNGT